MNQPPPLPASTAKGAKLFRQLANLSWIAFIAAFFVNFAVQTVPQELREKVPAISIVPSALIILIGVLSGAVALFGVFRHGRKGILLPALIGLGLWILCLGLAIPAYSKARHIAEHFAELQKMKQMTPIQHIAGADSVHDSELDFSFDVPHGFRAVSASSDVLKQYKYAYFKTDEPQKVLLVKPVGAPLLRHLTMQDLKGSTATLTTFSWRGLQVDATRVPEKGNDGDYVTFNVLIPLKKQTVEVGFGAPASDEEQTRKTVQEVLASFEAN